MLRARIHAQIFKVVSALYALLHYSSAMLTAKILTSIADAPAELFQQVDSPFLTQAFWRALEQSGAVSPETGWSAQHILLLDDNKKPLALLPLFAKNHHRGEYVFDYAWAKAYEQNGLDYYPRLVSCVPFTPVAGNRVWLAAGVSLNTVAPALLEAIKTLATDLAASSWHGLFLSDEHLNAFEQSDTTLAHRMGCQFLWNDEGYGDFDGFLATMTAKRRKMIKAERNKISNKHIACTFIEGANITPDDWAFFYACYERTYHVRGQTPYLNLGFFEQLGATLAQSIVLEIARDASGEPIAAALFFKDDTTLYGRYWGALYDIDCLHFEVCYYQGICYALAHNLRYFDPGTQGEHKLLRGFSPVYTHSLHWLDHPQFMQAVLHYVEREQLGVKHYFSEATDALPFKLKPVVDGATPHPTPSKSLDTSTTS